MSCECSEKDSAAVATPKAWEALNQLKFPKKKEKKERVTDGRPKKKKI